MMMVMKNMKNEDVFENTGAREVRNSKGSEIDDGERDFYFVDLLETGNSKRETEKKSGPTSSSVSGLGSRVLGLAS